ncbi:hypothetical protein SUDANB146_06311 [Streptomyces sp. enrichment culture]
MPAERVGCSGVTPGRRLQDWTEAGVRPRPYEVLPAELRKTGLLEMDDATADGSHVRALKGARTGPSPAGHGRPGSKHHLITNRHGTPSRCP